MKISGIDFYVPDEAITNQCIIKSLGFELEFLRDKLGIQERRHMSGDESCHTLAHKATSKLLERLGITAPSIDFLIVVTQNPDYRLPGVAPLLQHSLGLNKKSASFDLSLGCSGFIYALAIAKGLMGSCRFNRGLIVTSDPYSRIISPRDRVTYPLFGDAAASVLVEHSHESSVGEFDFGTDGSGAESLIVKGGGSKHPEPFLSEKDNHLFMDGRAIYTFMMKEVPHSVERCLALNNLRPDDIDYYVFHQASRYMLQSLMQRMEIPESKMVFAMHAYGNTVSSSIPIALESLLEQPAHSGKRALLSGFGVGLSWGSVVVTL